AYVVGAPVVTGVNLTGGDIVTNPTVTATGQVIVFGWTGVSIARPTSGVKGFDLTYQAVVRPKESGGLAGTYTNNLVFDPAGTVLELGCPGAAALTDTCATAANFVVREVASINSYKWVQSDFVPTNHIRPDIASYTTSFIPNGAFDCTSPISGEQVLRNSLLATYVPAGTATTPDYSRNPCAAQGNPGETFEYLIEIINQGNVDLGQLALYDILPYIGDTGVSQAASGQSRSSEFVVLMNPANANPVTVTGSAGTAFTVQYNSSTNPCRNEMNNGLVPTTTYPGGACNNTWSSTSTAVTRSFRVIQTAGLTAPAQSITITVDAYIPTHANLTALGLSSEADRALVGEVAWNTYAYRFYSQSTGRWLLAAEPRKVGIRIPERLSVGNRVWIDDGGNPGVNNNLANNRVRNSPDEDGRGVANVTVQLYRWDGTGALPSLTGGSIPANVNLVAQTMTDANGYYLFETDQRAAGLDVDGAGPGTAVTAATAYDWLDTNGVATSVESLYSLRPDNYFVFIPASNFDASGDPLYGYVSSEGVTDDASPIRDTADNRDTGVDTGLGSTATEPAPHINGVNGGWFTLQYPDVPLTTTNNSRLPLNESNLNTTGAYGPYGRGNYFQRDGYSDLTRDFGFVRTMTIGNRVWYDTGTATGYGQGTGSNNGLFDGPEIGAAGVTVRLYRVQQEETAPNSDIFVPKYDLDGVTPQIQNGYFTGANVVDPTYAPVTASADYLETTTDANGYYQFEGLLPGNYVVYLPPSNFTFASSITGDAPLATYANSTGNSVADAIFNAGGTQVISAEGLTGSFGNGDDNRDKGIENDFLQQAGNGIYSQVIHLRPFVGQTITETDLGARSHGNSVINLNSNLTADFGFYQPPMSLGNRVWRDYNNNGIQDAGEPGISGVSVELYYDENSDGIPDNGGGLGATANAAVTAATNATLTAPGTVVATTSTDADGYYRFDNLRPGRYVVRVAPSNFADVNGRALRHLTNSVPDFAIENTDMNDNGRTPATVDLYTTQGVYSNTVTLIPRSEPNDTGGGTSNAVAGEERDDGVDTAPNGVIGTNPRGQGTDPNADRNTDLTVDFGFYRPSSIGNRVWIDDGRGGAAAIADGSDAELNDGVQNGSVAGTEGAAGIAGVT
ncbi:MAG: SdrD B-like domain-containing protein, partial [Phototrophicaceae bacterium]